MSPIDDLATILAGYEKGSPSKNLTWSMTTNEFLGFETGGAFLVPIPYADTWPNPMSKAPATFESALAQAVKDTMNHGIKVGPVNPNGNYFIDFTQLNDFDKPVDGGWMTFWTKRSGGADQTTTLARAVINSINLLPSTATPVIRFLIGSNGDEDAAKRWSNEFQNRFAQMFWDSSGQPLCTHKNAVLHVGFYSPNFSLKQLKTSDAKGVTDNIDPLLQVIRDMIDNVFAVIQKGAGMAVFQEEHDEIMAHLKSDQVVNYIKSQLLPTISWNHAKFCVLDGKFLLTGGGNYWDEYADNSHALSDLSCKIKGDAAISAHLYCDHFWDYLNSAHTTDQNSFHKMVQLNQKLSPSPWKDGMAVPLFKALGRASMKSSSTSKNVLTVAKLGDWTEQTTKLQYPIQIIDAFRDVIQNILFRKYWTNFFSIMGGTFTSVIMPALNDDKMMSSFAKAGIYPTAWASRIARCQAISKATKSVYIDAEFIAGFLQADQPAWKTFLDGNGLTGANQVKGINDAAGLTGKNRWDGVLWSYDLVFALAGFLSRLQDPVQSGDGLCIILTTDKGSGGDVDKIPANELKQRLRWLKPGDVAGDDAAFDTWFNARCSIRRISADGSMGNHCKVVCCDKKLLYIGSDNPYPNYNEEFGVWIDDSTAITGWLNNYWTPRWSQIKPADMGPNAGDAKFPGTMEM